MSQRGFLNTGVLLAVVLGLVVFVGGAYFVIQQNPSSQTASENFDNLQQLPTTNNQVQTQTTTNAPAQTQTPVPNTALATFSDARVSYTFKYPNKYRADVFDYGTNSNEVCIVGVSVKNPQGCWMQFRTGITSELFSAQKLIDGDLSVNAVYEQEAVREGQTVPAHRRHVINTAVGNIPAKGIVSTARDGKQNLISIVLDRGNLTYVFSSGAVLNSSEYKEFMDIMSSVSFRSSQQTNQGSVSVPGMSKYTDSDFGFSFWYPSGWQITSAAVNPYPLSEGTTLKHLLLTGGSAPIHILEFTSPTRTISIGGGACGFCAPIKFYFDAEAHTWMKQYPQGVGGAPDMAQAQFEQTKIPQPADVSNNTMGGLHIFHGLSQRFGDSTVPLSARNFVFVYAESQGENNIELPLVNTIVALDPSVATPVSAAQQTQTIQAEANAYSY